MTPDEWLEKAECEGGILDGLDYGLYEGDVDEEYPHFREIVRTARMEYGGLLNAIDTIENYEGENN